MRTGRVRFEHSIKIVSLCCVPDAKPGDCVLVQAGLALSVLDGVQAETTLGSLRGIGEPAAAERTAAPVRG